ncbi:hypothetical protein GH733_006601 [Mirounga leonina]|nr:hypothetical protein GH733_006601 [Mirounga leonina]
MAIYAIYSRAMLLQQVPKVLKLHNTGSPIKVTLATLKMSAQPTVSLGDFEITPPVVLRLRCGSGPVHISGQHLALEEDAEPEDEEEEIKHSAPGSGSKVPQKIVKLAADEDDDEEEEAEEKAPVKKCIRDTPAKKCTKIKPECKRLETINTKIKRSRIFQNKQKKTKKKNRKRLPKTPK